MRFLTNYQIEKLIILFSRLQEECGVAMYVDLHAHSRKHNVFIYGCESRKNSDKHLQEQVFPLMLHKNAADKVINPNFLILFNY